MGKKRLTPKQWKFIEYYLECENATEAALRAGYSEKNARNAGSENLKNPYIQAEIAARRKAAFAAEGIDADWVLMQLARTAKANILDAVDLVDITDINGEDTGTQALKLDMDRLRGIKTGVAGVKNTREGVEVKMKDGMKALELLGRHFGLFEQQDENACDDRDWKATIIAASKRRESKSSD